MKQGGNQDDLMLNETFVVFPLRGLTVMVKLHTPFFTARIDVEVATQIDRDLAATENVILEPFGRATFFSERNVEMVRAFPTFRLIV